MKKIFRNPICMFILGLIVMASIVGVYAINSSDVVYKGTKVDQALDTLYENIEKTNNIVHNMIVNNGTAQFRIDDTIKAYYSKFKVTSVQNLFNTGTCQYAIYNNEGTESIPIIINNEYDIQDLYTTGYRKIQLSNTNGWCALFYSYYN